MTLEIVSIIISTCLTALIISFIIWDHIKDDRFLTKQVQEFFSNIEGLVFTQYFYNLYKALFNALKSIQDTRLSDYNSINYEEIDKQFASKLFFLREKVRLGIKDYGKYLGIISNQREEIRKNNLENENKLDVIYYSHTDMILSYYGELTDLSGNLIVNDFTKIFQEKEGWDIYYFLGSLRDYWQNKYKKTLLRKKLKINKKRHDIKRSFFDFQKCFEKITIYQSTASPSILAYLVKHSNEKLEKIIDILKGSIRTNPYHKERVYENLGLQFLKDK
jgi:hypothetical protein